MKWYKSLLSDIPTNVRTVTLHLAGKGQDGEGGLGYEVGTQVLWGQDSRKELRGVAGRLLEPGAPPTSWALGVGHWGPALTWSPRCTPLAVRGGGGAEDSMGQLPSNPLCGAP